MDYVQNIGQLPIDKNIITIIASGGSVEKITKEQFEFLKEKTYVITMNYGPVKFIGHANIFSDIKVTEFIKDIYSRKEKDHLFIARRDAFIRGNEWDDFKTRIDYWFDTEKLKGHYTLIWIFQLLQQWFSSKFVLVFGMDLKPIDDANDIKKWYDRYTKQDVNRRGRNFPLQKKLDQFQQEIITLKNTNPEFSKWCDRVINCNPDSNCIVFKKMSLEQLIGEDKNIKLQ